MTRFKGGPADKKCLMLRNSPEFLRVVECQGKFDALDAPGDKVNLTETPHAYKLVEKTGGAFIDGPKVRGFYPIQTYQWILEQPPKSVMESNTSWEEWMKQAKP